MSDLGAKQFAVQVLRNLGHRGGSASVHQLAPNDRESRRRVRAALQLAAREGLVTSPNAERYTLTAKAWAAIRESLAPAEATS